MLTLTLILTVLVVFRALLHTLCTNVARLHGERRGGISTNVTAALLRMA